MRERIYNHLKKYVKGQDEAIKRMSVALELHRQRIAGTGTQRENILIAGPTGCGKTQTIRAIHTLGLDCPIQEVSAIEYSPNAWRGRDMRHMFEFDDLPADEPEKYAGHAIVVIDEFDKILCHPDYSHDWQSTMLKIMEGTDIVLFNQDDLPKIINTSGMLFILIGAFPAMKEITKSLGFGAGQRKTTRQDYVTYGMMPELLGRVPVICEYKQVTADMLVDVLKNTNSIYKEWQLRFKKVGVDFKMTDAELREMAENALNEGIGARGLLTAFADKLYPMYRKEYEHEH